MVSPQHARRSFSRRQPQRLLRASLLAAALYAGCNVYDPSLLPVGGAAGGGAAEGGAGNSEAGSEAAAGSENPSNNAGNASGGVGGRGGMGGGGSPSDIAGTPAVSGTPTGGGAGGPPIGEGGVPNAAGQPDGGGSAGEGGAPPAPVLHELALGQPALASSTQTNNDAFKGNDGDTGTRWCASGGTFPQWWRVDLGRAHELATFSVRFEYSQRGYSYVIETSTDDTTFTAVPGTTATDAVGSVQSGVFPAGTSARYVRISVTNADPPSTTWASFFEFSVLGY